jgi:RNA polymerase sigma factor (TIGR02999 family)
MMADVTQLLDAAAAGDRRAAADLLPLVYDELRQLAAQRVASEKPGQTLQATALVHEAYLRLVGPANAKGFTGRGHFFAAAAEAMRRILVENARRKQRLRHGGDHDRVELEDAQVSDRDRELIELDDALAKLAVEDQAAADVAKMHIFVGLSVEEAAEALILSRATAYRHWNYAKAWLRCEMTSETTRLLPRTSE